jgi:hypothetical protein
LTLKLTFYSDLCREQQGLAGDGRGVHVPGEQLLLRLYRSSFQALRENLCIEHSATNP